MKAIGLGLVLAFAVVGCGDSEEAPETGAALDSTWAFELQACNADCEREFGECAAGAPERWYEWSGGDEDPRPSWAYTDEAGCKTECAKIAEAAPGQAPIAQDCVDWLTGFDACRRGLTCDEYWEQKDGNEEWHCPDYEETGSVCREFLTLVYGEDGEG